jgi:hypothetical protein
MEKVRCQVLLSFDNYNDLSILCKKAGVRNISQLLNKIIPEIKNWNTQKNGFEKTIMFLNNKIQEQTERANNYRTQLLKQEAKNETKPRENKSYD